MFCLQFSELSLELHHSPESGKYQISGASSIVVSLALQLMPKLLPAAFVCGNIGEVLLGQGVAPGRLGTVVRLRNCGEVSVVNVPGALEIWLARPNEP
jgi:hypothetical protein